RRPSRSSAKSRPKALSPLSAPTGPRSRVCPARPVVRLNPDGDASSAFGNSLRLRGLAGGLLRRLPGPVAQRILDRLGDEVVEAIILTEYSTLLADPRRALGCDLGDPPLNLHPLLGA